MDIFSITSIIIFFSSIGFALTLYSGNTKSKLNRSWLSVSAAISIWGLSLYGVTSTNSGETALLWQYALDVAAIFIPIFYLFFIFTFLNISIKYVKIFLISTGVILSLFSFSSLYKLGVAKDILGFYWIDPGPYYFLFPTFFITLALVATGFLVRAYIQNKEDPVFRGQIRNQILAGSIAFIGGTTNFFPQFFDIYPFGNYFVILYLFFMSYSVLRYKFLDLKVASTQLFSGAMVLIFLFNLLQSVSLEEWFVRFIFLGSVLLFSIFLVKSVYKEIEAREDLEILAKDLEEANVRLRELDRIKSEFVSIASHQLRTPLTVIKGYASMIIEGTYGRFPNKARGAISRIFEASDLMIASVEDFLNVSRIEQGRMQYNKSDFDVADLAKDVVNGLVPTATKKGLELSFKREHSNSFITNGDLGKLKQVFSNLIDNSIKYTTKGSIEVYVSRVGGDIQFKVSDTGVGIPKDDVNKLFDKFIRARNAHEVNVSGTGLGLYVAKEIVEAHEGKIWAESEGEGKGSTFFVELKCR